MKKHVLFFILVSLHLHSFCQTQLSNVKYPEVGKPMPDFILSDVENFSKKQIGLADFKGKWLVLDWWTQFCISCIASFPKVNSMQKEFQDQVQFVFVGYTGSWLYASKVLSSDQPVRTIYKKAMLIHDMIVPFAFDSILYRRYNLGTTPYIIIIDPKGIVRGITSHFTSKDLNSLLEGRKVSLDPVYRRDEEKPAYDRNIPFLTYGNGGTDTGYLFRSLLAKWQPGSATYLPYRIVHTNGRFEEIGTTLEKLYQLAYLGQSQWSYTDSLYSKIYPKVILELKDSSAFQENINTGDGYFSYSLTIPAEKASRSFIMQMMRNDLINYFGYEVSIQTRKMPYWRLVASEEAKLKLKTKGEKFYFQENKHAGFSAKNYPIKNLLGYLWGYNQSQPPFVDETGIEGNIDIAINALLTDFNDFKRGLNENGLNLVKGEKDMKVLVITDKNKN